MKSGLSHTYLEDAAPQQHLQMIRTKFLDSLSQKTRDKLFFCEGNLKDMPKEGISEFDLTLLYSIQSLLYAEERIDLLQEWVSFHAPN